MVSMIAKNDYTGKSFWAVEVGRPLPILTDQERLLTEGWTLNCPLLGEAYRLKEAFYGIYDCATADAIRYAICSPSRATSASTATRTLNGRCGVCIHSA